MPTVRVEPLGAEIEVEPGEALTNAAWRQGYRWPTRCWGQADCMVCRVRVLSGEEHVQPPGDFEIDALRNKLGLSVDRDRARLACRLYVTGDGAVVEKENVGPPPG